MSILRVSALFSGLSLVCMVASYTMPEYVAFRVIAMASGCINVIVTLMVTAVEEQEEDRSCMVCGRKPGAGQNEFTRTRAGNRVCPECFYAQNSSILVPNSYIICEICGTEAATVSTEGSERATCEMHRGFSDPNSSIDNVLWCTHCKRTYTTDTIHEGTRCPTCSAGFLQPPPTTLAR